MGISTRTYLVSIRRYGFVFICAVSLYLKRGLAVNRHRPPPLYRRPIAFDQSAGRPIARLNHRLREEPIPLLKETPSAVAKTEGQ